MGDAWATGSAYEDFMGRWSRRLAPRFVSWLSVRPGATWLDVGCGTGALSDAIRSEADPASVVACDPSEPFIEFARRRASERVSFAVAGVGQLPTRPGGFDSVTSLLALNFFPEPERAIDEMRQRAAANGLVSACVWDYAGRMQFLRSFWDAVAAVDPAAAAQLDEGRRFPICHPDALEALFRGGGLADVVSDAIEIPTRFASFADFWTPFLGATGPAPSYVAGLDPSRREALAARIERALPRGPDGSIGLVARAWAVRGVARG